jgi:hypothetical protein
MAKINFTVIICLLKSHFPVAGHLAPRQLQLTTAPFPRNLCWPGREAVMTCLQVERKLPSQSNGHLYNYLCFNVLHFHFRCLFARGSVVVKALCYKPGLTLYELNF